MCPGAGIVNDTVTLITPGGGSLFAGPTFGMMTVAVDLAVKGDGTQVAFASTSGQMAFGGVTIVPFAFLQAPAPPGMCFTLPPQPNPGQTIAVAFDGQSRIISQTRAPSAILVNNQAIPLGAGGAASIDGLATFYMATKAGIACASCHPEAGDDGRVWQFVGLGPRRTQNLRGGVLARAPFHWSGDIVDMDALAKVVFEGRMAGPNLAEDQITALGQWMDAQPALAAPPPADAAAVARGDMVFHDPTVGCTGCHSGPQVSDHKLFDVGTGGVFKVPSLIAVGYRAPYLHDGCAATLLDRFGPACGGGDQHGHTSQLSPQQLSDLVAYLQSL
jgi:hypothetical protein